MPHPKLLRLAEEEVGRALRQLPDDVADAARECVIVYKDVASSEDTDADDEDESLLGLFEGYSRLQPLPGDPDQMPRITLFLGSLWDMAEEDEREFRKEVRLTYFHELGHYLGWDEDKVAAMGLG